MGDEWKEKWTDGPWEAHECRVVSLGQTKVICDTATRKETRTQQCNIANARLISAAPDLAKAAGEALAHLEELREAWQIGAISEHNGKGGTRSNRNVDAINTLASALAKARWGEM